MKGIQVQIKDYKVANTFDMIKATLKFITLGKDLELSDTELYTLTYFETETKKNLNKARK